MLLPTVPFGLLMVLSIPWVGHLALGSLEWQYPPLGRRPASAEAIVVLGGGITPPDSVRRRAVLNQDSIYRCLHAVEIYRQGRPCPVLVSGGKVEPDAPTLAQAMGILLEELGVNPSDIIEESNSLTTYENSVGCAELLRRRQIRRVILITEAAHMPRALGAICRQGVEAIPSACHY
ncbi:MAG: YdcF family protein, partial [Planctomycetaceae bacterium]|nr:YdcF family protein [Planctomycetaceae bacterium]